MTERNIKLLKLAHLKLYTIGLYTQDDIDI